MDGKDEQRCIDRVLGGEVNAFGPLVERYQKPIFNLMYRMAGSSDKAADLTQETFIRAYQKLERFHPGKRFFPWLYSIGLNLARDFARKNTRDIETRSTLNPESISGCNYPGDQHDRMCESLEFLRLEKALDELPVIYREALILRYHDECSMRDIAAALNLSLSAAKMRVHRGLNMLREHYRGGNP
ncbi:MAG: sigma-70 family RNA polymerase sigma factor [Desulfobacterales bacterium]|nr:sigma-70 family RNA polymerase sigma factor [Desulfobacterales bacterium]